MLVETAYDFRLIPCRIENWQSVGLRTDTVQHCGLAQCRIVDRHNVALWTDLVQDCGLLPYSTDIKVSEQHASSFFKVWELLPRRSYSSSGEGSGSGGLQIIQPLRNTWGEGGSTCGGPVACMRHSKFLQDAKTQKIIIWYVNTQLQYVATAFSTASKGSASSAMLLLLTTENTELWETGSYQIPQKIDLVQTSKWEHFFYHKKESVCHN